MKAEIAIFPFGDFDGAPVVALDLSAGTTAEEIKLHARGATRSGVQGLWIRSAPFGDFEVENALMHVVSDPEFSHLPLLGLRGIECKKWFTLDVGWVADCSSLTAQPIGIGALRERLLTMDFRPKIGELVIGLPHTACLKPSILDALFEDVMPAGRGWIYTDKDPIEVMPAVLGAATPWLIRRARQGW